MLARCSIQNYRYPPSRHFIGIEAAHKRVPEEASVFPVDTRADAWQKLNEGAAVEDKKKPGIRLTGRRASKALARRSKPTARPAINIRQAKAFRSTSAQYGLVKPRATTVLAAAEGPHHEDFA
jgi:hypothetical protein